MSGRKRFLYELKFFDTHSAANLPIVTILRKFNFLANKPIIFFQKNQSLYVLRLFFFQSLFRQFWYNSVMKSFKIRNVGHGTFSTTDFINWQVSVENVRVEWMFCVVFLYKGEE